MLCFPYPFLFCSVLHILCQAGEAFTAKADWCLWNLRENYLSALSAFRSTKQWFSTGKNLRANKENIILGQTNQLLHVCRRRCSGRTQRLHCQHCFVKQGDFAAHHESQLLLCYLMFQLSMSGGQNIFVKRAACYLQWER